MRSGARNSTVVLLLALALNGFSCGKGAEFSEGELSEKASAYSQWENGPGADPGFFPIAVWLQNPSNADRYKAAGINLYVGLWKGPTAPQLVALKKAGMPVICSQNEAGLTHDYFVHQFKPRFNEKALLDNPEMLKAVTSINRQIHGLAPVLNSPSAEGEVIATSSRDGVPIDIMVKRHEGATYVFAVCMRDVPVTASFEINTARTSGPVTVLGEGRTLRLSENTFRDEFKGYGVHLYRIPA